MFGNQENKTPLLITTQEDFNQIKNELLADQRNHMERIGNDIKITILDQDVWLNQKEACKYIKASESQLDRYRKDPENGIVFSKPSHRHLLYLKSSLNNFLLKYSKGGITEAVENTPNLRRRARKY